MTAESRGSTKIGAAKSPLGSKASSSKPAANKKRPRLGRGLDGLLPSSPTAHSATQARIEELHPNRDQPRRHFDDDALQDLAASIEVHGVLEPILVRRRGGDGFEIIAGERRWRAAQKAGLHEVPIFVRELSDRAAFEAALVENVQREDLSPIETARAFQRLIDEFDYTQERVAERVGKDRSTVSNALRLLKLPPEALDLVAQGALTEGHGRALLTAPDASEMLRLARRAVAEKLSVREVERCARAANGKTADSGSGSTHSSSKKSANVLDLERRLSDALGTTVTVEDQKGKGAIHVRYASYDALDEILRRLLP